MVGVSMFVLCLALFLARQYQVIDQRARALSQLDHKFLDDLFRYQENRQQDDSAPTPVPKTELTMNAKPAKRAELVVHNVTVKRSEMVQPTQN